MKKTIFCAAFFSTILCSCGDKEGKSSVCVSNMSSIAGNYKTIAVQYKASVNAVEQDFFVMLNACEKDDIIKLNANGTAEYTDAGIQCNPNTSYTSNWSVNGSNIAMDGETGAIKLYDCKKLVVASSGVIVAGDQLTVTYQKQ